MTSKAETAARLPGSPREVDRSQEVSIDKDRLTGSAANLVGKGKEGAGDLIGDARLQSEGKLDQANGKVQNAVGGIKDALKGKS